MKASSKQKNGVVGSLRTLFGAVRFSRAALVCMCVFVATGVLCGIAFSVIVGQVTETVAGGQSFAMLRYVPLLLGVLAVQVISTFLQTQIQGRFAATTREALSNRTLKSLVRASQPWLDEQKSGELMTKAGEALEHAVTLLSQHCVRLLNISLSVALRAVYLFYNNWILATLFFALFPLIIFLQNNISKLVRRVVDERLEASGKCNNVSVDALRNLSTVKAYQLEETMSRRYEARSTQTKKLFYRFTFLKSVVSFFADLLAIVPSAAVCVGAFVLLRRGTLDFGAFLSFMLVMFSASSPLFNFGRIMTDVRGAHIGAERMLKVWEAPQEDRAQPACMPGTGDEVVRFEDVAFAYQAQDAVLKGVTFSIRKGEHVAVVGESGCGKSTLVRLMGHLYSDFGGVIQLFGQNLKAWNPVTLRKHMAIVTQSSDLFPVSIQDNIAWGRDGAPEADIHAVCKSAGIAAFIQSLPEGYQTLAGERGTQLSGGQKQRVAIARALLRDAPLVILDEATSALDTATELQVQAELERLMVGKTAIIIAHRLSSIRHVDRILVMEDGRIVEEGTHGELFARRGAYYDLYQKQAEQVVKEGGEAVG